MNKSYLSVLIFFAFSLSILSQTMVSESIETTGFKNLDTYLTDHIEKNVIPGGVFLIAEKGKIKYFKSFGFDDKAEDKAYQNDDIFRIASMTKSFTVVGILQLMEKKKLKLDDPVSKYIPAFKDTKVLNQFNAVDSSYTVVDQTNELSIRNLLTHTSGIYYGGFEADSLIAVYAKNDLMSFGLSTPEWTTEEMANKIAKAPLAFQPGSKYKYGLNMEILGRIIEVASGMPLNQYFRINIFEPLGLKDTYFYLPEEKYDRLVKVHPSDTVQNIIENPFIDYPLATGRNHFAGGGGLSSTTLDYATFCMALANEGSFNNQRILKKKTVKMLSKVEFEELDQSKQGFQSEVEEMGFGLGYWVIKKENPEFSPLSEGSFGWSGYFNTKYYIDPKKDIVIIGMTQMMSFNNQPFWREFLNLAYKK